MGSTVKAHRTPVTRGFAVDRAAAARLKAAGVRSIYCAADGELPGKKFQLRAGETLSVVDGLRTFGKTRREMMAAVKMVHSWGAHIVDVDSGENSRDHWVDMLERALTFRSLPIDKAKAMAALSRAVRRERRWHEDRAARAWFNLVKYPDADVFYEATGWAPSTAYKEFGPRVTVRRRQKAK